MSPVSFFVCHPIEAMDNEAQETSIADEFSRNNRDAEFLH